MQTPELITKAAPYARAVIEDDDLRGHLRSAARSGRAALIKPAPKPTRVQRAGVALRSAGAALTSFGAAAERRRRARRRAVLARGAAAAGAVAVAAAAFRSQTNKETSHV